jgi:hypothetical protein
VDQEIILFLHKDIENHTSLSFPYLSVTGIVTHTLRRNKTIRRNHTTAPRFILSAKAETTERIISTGSGDEAVPHRRERYINASEYKGQSKNPYEVVLIQRNGGDRP